MEENFFISEYENSSSDMEFNCSMNWINALLDTVVYGDSKDDNIIQDFVW